jgi:zinc protease
MSPQRCHTPASPRPTLVRLALLVVMAFTFSPAYAVAPRQLATIEGITEYQFDNGLRLLLYPDQSQAKFTVNMTVLVGSRHEGFGEAGMAHLLEHMVFKGTPRHPNVPLALRNQGAAYNGTTSSDRTNYFETLTATDANLEFAIDLEADRLVNSFVRQEDLESEMTVVRNEFERSENSVSGLLRRRIGAVAYDWHNYGKSTIGNRTDIERVPIDNLRAFYRKYYQPDNVVLIVAGKFDVAKALGYVNKHFGAIPRPTRKLDQTWTEEPPQDGERMVTLRRVGDVGLVGVAYHIPSGIHADAATMQVAANVLNQRTTGRLFRALVTPRKAISVSAFASNQHDPSLFLATAEVAKEASTDEVREILVATIEAFGKSEVTAEDVTRAKQQILKARELAATDTAQIGVSLSDWVGQGDWRLYFLHRDRIEQVTPEAVKACAARYLQRNNRTVGVFIPTAQAERTDVPPSPDIASLVADYKGRAAISEGEEFDPTPANIEARVSRMELPGGLRVTLLPRKSRGQEVVATLALRYGNDQNLKGLEAAATFLPGLMLQGTKKLTGQQFRDQLDRLGATISAGGAGAGRGRGGRGGAATTQPLGTVIFSVQAKRETLPEVLELLGQVLREPRLPASQIETVRRERIAALEQTKSDPATLAPRMLTRSLNPYTPDDVRYTPTIEESIDRLKSVTHDQIARLHKEFLGGTTGELTIVGDFDPDAALPVVKQSLAGWKAAQPYARIVGPTPTAMPGARHVINTPDKANATYNAGLMFAMRDDDADYPALLMGNYILGSGTLASRLGVRIRQKEGLSYGVSSALGVSMQDQRANLTITAIVNPKNMARLEVCVQEELKRFLDDGITAEELDKARAGYLEAMKVSRASDSAIANALTGYRYAGRTYAWQAELQQKIEALTPAQVGVAMRKHIDPAKLVIVVAGDFETKATAAGGG